MSGNGQWPPELPTITSLQLRLQHWVDRQAISITLFLSVVLFATVFWRIGFFINDNYTVANTLVAVGEGQLSVDRIVYGPESGATPGMGYADGHRYGRNYGLVFSALPFLWVFQALSTIADLQVAIAALWSGLILSLALVLGRISDRQRTLTLAGCLLALGAFVSNLLVGASLAERWVALVALQTSTAVWFGLLCVVGYWLVSMISDRRAGLFAGITLGVATPLGFWATIPKRHILISLLALVTIYAFARSRHDPDQQLRYRAVAYGSVAWSAWVFPIEGALLFVALVPVDILTAPSNRPRDLAVLGGVFLVGALPMLITNTLITGNPLLPPGLLPSYTGNEPLIVENGGSGLTSGSGGGGGSGGGSTGSSGQGKGPFGPVLITMVLSLANSLLSRADLLWSRFLGRGFTVLITEPDRLFHTFIHSGYIERVATEDGGEAINLALIESAPILATLIGAPLAVFRRHSPTRLQAWLASPVGQTDLLIGLYTSLVTITYIRVLPLHAMVTVRYLLPILPGLVYFLSRLQTVRAVIHTQARALVATYVIGIVIGGQLILIALLLLKPGLGEAIQLHAVIGLLAALACGVWVVGATGKGDDYTRVGAIIVGLSAAVTTNFILLSGWFYFSSAGRFAIPLIRWITGSIPLF